MRVIKLEAYCVSFLYYIYFFHPQSGWQLSSLRSCQSRKDRVQSSGCHSKTKANLQNLFPFLPSFCSHQHGHLVFPPAPLRQSGLRRNIQLTRKVVPPTQALQATFRRRQKFSNSSSLSRMTTIFHRNLFSYNDEIEHVTICCVSGN